MKNTSSPLAAIVSDVASAPELPAVADLELADKMAKPTDRSRSSSTFSSSSYFAKALPAQEGGFMGQYSAPGLLPSRVKNAQDQVAVFETEEAAELAAAREMIEILNVRSRRMQQGKLQNIRKLAPAEFAAAMSEANIGITLFAYIFGTDPARVLRWLQDPEQGIPHPVRVLLAIFTKIPSTIQIAERVTDRVATAKHPPREPGDAGGRAQD